MSSDVLSGRRAFLLQRRYTVRSTGAIGSENLGLSNEKQGENPCRRKSKVSWGRFVRPGLVGPKPRPKGVGDGQQVNIPVPCIFRYQDGVVEKDRLSAVLVVRVQARRRHPEENPWMY